MFASNLRMEKTKSRFERSSGLINIYVILHIIKGKMILKIKDKKAVNANDISFIYYYSYRLLNF